MKLIVNGQPMDLPDEASVADAVSESGAPTSGRGVAVAVNGEVVPRGNWASIRLADGDRVEVLKAVSGG